MDDFKYLVGNVENKQCIHAHTLYFEYKSLIWSRITINKHANEK